MIQSFKANRAEDLFFDGKKPRKCGWSKVYKAAKIRLDYLDAASSLEDLKIPPSNRLRRLKGELKNYYSMSINSQWRIIFRWTDAGPTDVAVVDYH